MLGEGGGGGVGDGVRLATDTSITSRAKASGGAGGWRAMILETLLQLQLKTTLRNHIMNGRAQNAFRQVSGQLRIAAGTNVFYGTKAFSS